MDTKVFFQKNFRYAVVGATTNVEKYGFRVLQYLHAHQLDVVGVNPKYSSVSGVPCYASIEAIPKKPDVLVFVVPPQIGLHILHEAHHYGFTKIWFQPGAESQETTILAGHLGMTVNDPGTCIMVEHRKLQG
ncbi:MAG: CoA-binding protein [Patescibacteria group bacterium]|jgi:hypothetical protein